MNGHMNVQDYAKVLPLRGEVSRIKEAPRVVHQQASFDGLSTRARNAIKWLEATSIGELCRHSEADILRVPNVGMVTLDEINEWLADHGRALDDGGQGLVLVNQSGINPTEYRVLIDPMPVEEKVGSIYIPPSEKEKQEFAQTRGRIVAASPLAFTYATQGDWEAAHATKPKAGDVVLYAKHSGVPVKGKDGKGYQLVIDRDIVATLEE